MKMILSVIASLVLGFSAHAGEYSKAVTSVTSVSIPSSEHGLGCSGTLSIRVLDSSGNLLSRSSYTRSISNCTVNLTFSFSFTGTVKLKGPYSVTSAYSDFEVTAEDGTSGTEAKMRVCSQCSSTSYAYRSDAGIMESQRSWTFNGQGNGQTSTIRVFLEGNTLVFASSTSSGGSCDAVNSDCEVRTFVSSFPSGVKQLFQGSLFHDGSKNRWTSTSDLRGY